MTTDKIIATQHYVMFYSPGTLVAESTRREIDSWDVDEAVALAEGITERHGATPYGFRFLTRQLVQGAMDAQVTNTSNMYFLGGTVSTLEEIEEANDPGDSILLSNMRMNDISRIWTSSRGWRWTQPFNDGDILIDRPEFYEEKST